MFNSDIESVGCTIIDIKNTSIISINPIINNLTIVCWRNSYFNVCSNSHIPVVKLLNNSSIKKSMDTIKINVRICIISFIEWREERFDVIKIAHINIINCAIQLRTEIKRSVDRNKLKYECCFIWLVIICSLPREIICSRVCPSISIG